MRLAWTACLGESAEQERFCPGFASSVRRAICIDWYKSLPDCARCYVHKKEGSGHGQKRFFLALVYLYILWLCFVGDAWSTHKL